MQSKESIRVNSNLWKKVPEKRAKQGLCTVTRTTTTHSLSFSLKLCNFDARNSNSIPGTRLNLSKETNFGSLK